MLARRCVAFVFACVFVLTALAASAQDVRPDQTIALLVTTAPGAPTADALVAYYEGAQITPPPLQGLTVGNPQKIVYLMPLRAQGDSLANLQAHPDSVRAALERYVVVIYPVGTDRSAPLAALRADPYVLAAYPTPTSAFSTSEEPVLAEPLWAVGGPKAPSTDSQYGRADMNIDAAWQMAGGYALIADVDSGLYEQHASLQQFDAAGHFAGGGFVPVHSMDISLTGLIDGQNSDDVDERRPMPVVDPACNPDPINHPDMQPITAGHGTHVSGLMIANGNAGLGVQGTCKKCSIGMWKTALAGCNEQNHEVELIANFDAQAAALGRASETGGQVANMSFGVPTQADGPYPNFCQLNPSNALCLNITHASNRDVAMIASSGNGRTQLDFPAADTRVISAGGFQENLTLWDLWPNCPQLYGLSQCGSNFTTVAGGAPQELMGSAQSVLSTTYPGYNWNPALQCGDGFPGPGFGNGTGWCTGTSMSAPQIAGILGILRSINPLVHVGADPSVPGSLRRVLASTTFEAQANQSWNPFTGYGRPDAAAAVHKMLGDVAGSVARNRATPLFRLYSIGAKDYADTTSPQMAIGMMINTTHAWQPIASLPLVPGYPTFPHDPGDGAQPPPRASVYVLTDEYRPRSEWPALVPLYLMDKDFSGAYRDVDDFMLVTTTTDIEYAHNNGYNLRAIQGYVYGPCSPEPGCIPPSAQKFYRACNTAASDCATFLESESATFAAAGYTSTFPPIGGTKTLLGYAYRANDTDGDGLPDGFEYVVGTSPVHADSDADGLSDAYEYPMIGVPFSDPCAGGVGAKNCGADVIFRNGFEFP